MDFLNGEFDLLKQLEEEKKASEILEISGDISDTYLWVLCAFGIPGNVFTIVSVLTMGKTSTATFFVALLAACDGLALVAKLAGHLIYENMVKVGDVGCKLLFIPLFVSAMANWSLVLIALERFFSVCFPLKKAFLFTKSRSYLIAAIICTVLFVIFATVFSVMYEANDSGRVCGNKPVYIHFFTNAWYWINATIFLFLPFIISMVLTVLIILGLNSSRKARRSMLQKSESDSTQGKAEDNNRKLLKETERAERMITIMLILASVLFVVLALPACVELLARPETDDPVRKAKWDLFKQISHVLLDSTHAINFFLYFISAKRFRNHFIHLLTCKRFPRRDVNSAGSHASNATESSKLSTAI